MTTKEIFDESVKTAKEIVRPHLKTYNDYMTEQEWEIAILLFKHKLNKKEIKGEI